MKSRSIIALALSIGALSVAATSASAATPITVNGGWTAFTFGGPTAPVLGPVAASPFTFTSTRPTRLEITDTQCPGDQFLLSDGNKKLGNTSPTRTDSCNPIITDPDQAFANKNYSHGTWTFLPGTHTINVSVIENTFSGVGTAYIRVDTIKK
jgi:hypothetical protein